MPEITKAKAKELKYPNPNLHTILINKNFGKDAASAWLKKHNYYSRNRLEKNYYRALQHNPVKDATYYSKKITPDIIFIFQNW